MPTEGEAVTSTEPGGHDVFADTDHPMNLPTEGEAVRPSDQSWRQMDGGQVGKEPLRFTLRWDDAMGCYRVSIPNLEGPLQVVPAEAFDEVRAERDRRVAQTREEAERVADNFERMSGQYAAACREREDHRHEAERLERERDEAREQLAQAREGYWPAAEVLEALDGMNVAKAKVMARFGARGEQHAR